MEELIFNNFTDEEIRLMKVNPGYFKINTVKFQEIKYFKKKKLNEIFKEEDKGQYKDFNKIKAKMAKLSKKPMIE
jgi:hypothetical protein